MPEGSAGLTAGMGGVGTCVGGGGCVEGLCVCVQVFTGDRSSSDTGLLKNKVAFEMSVWPWPPGTESHGVTGRTG